MIAHCMFEQSGTFKNEFKKLGIEAYDYDILNDFGETDYILDLFAEIHRGGHGEPCVFDKISVEDIIVAFFPCIMFQENNALLFSGKAPQFKNYSISEKMEYNMKRHKKLNDFYTTLCQFVKVCSDRGLRLIIENPATKPHYLDYYFISPTFTDNDRRLNGDFYKKPTNYWFIGCEPKNNFIMEPLEWVQQERIEKQKNKNGVSRQVLRSMIHPQYANRFIREYIL